MLLYSQWSRSRCFSGIILFFLWPNRCWIFDLLFFCFLHLEVKASILESSWFTFCWNLVWRILSITLLACEMSVIIWPFEHPLALPFFEIVMKTDLFQFCGHYWAFQICWHVECSTVTVSSFRIWNNSARMPLTFPSKNTRACCHFLLQRIFQTLGSNPCLLCLLR